MKLLYKLFKQSPDSREGIITTTSSLGIFFNILIAIIKVIIGLITSSIAIISEGVNNATDAVNSIMTLIGARLSKKHPDEKHPFGYGRIEYLSSFLVAVLIIVTACELFLESIKLISNSSEMDVSYLSILIIAGTALIKIILGTYTVKMGTKVTSNSLIAIGKECRDDAFASVITIVSSLVYIIFGLSIDAYAGILIAILIFKAGFDALMETLNDLIGRPGEHELAIQLYKEIRSTDGVIAAVDMMLHNYGPEAWSGSVNVEIDHNKTVGEMYQILHDLQLRIMHEFNVVLVFGVYAVDNDHENIRELRKTIHDFIHPQEHVKSFHALYIDSKEMNIYCDFIVDYSLKNWDALEETFKNYMREKYPEYQVILTIETEFI